MAGMVAPTYDKAPARETARETATETWTYYNRHNLRELLTDLLELEREVAREGAKRILCFDTETTGLDPVRDELVLLQLYHPLRAPMIVDVRGADPEAMRLVLRGIFESEEWLKVAHNAYFDACFLRHKYSLRVERVFCTKVAENLLTLGLGDNARLETVAEKYLGLVMDKSTREEFHTRDPTQEPITADMFEYAAQDARVLYRIMERQSQRLREEELVSVAKLEFSIVPALVEATVHGVRIDRERWERHIDNLHREEVQRAEALRGEMYPYIMAHRRQKYESALAQHVLLMAEYEARKGYVDAQAQARYDQVLLETGSRGEARRAFNKCKREQEMPPRPPRPRLSEDPINLASPEQLGGALVQMGVPLKYRGRQYVTDKQALRAMQDEHAICHDILQWREYETLVTTFGEAVLQYVDEGVRLHPTYNQLVRTGRMSCSKPNIQQVPANTLGNEFRHCFVAPPGKKLVAADYSQIELRILAELSEEPALLRAYEEGRDLHAATAAEMFGVSYESVAAEDGANRGLRKVAKPINFGIAYGLGAAALSRNERIPIREAEGYIRRYFEAYPRLHEWINRTRSEGLERMYASTMLGRKRYFPPIEVDPRDDPREYRRIRTSYERQIGNHPIQGTSADITKLAIYKLHRSFTSGTGAVPILFVHDEIVVECGEGDAELVAGIVEAQMKAAATYFLKRVPVEVSVKIADTWEH